MKTDSDRSRLFQPFIDATDMVMCCPADALLGDIQQEAAGHGLRFPLVCDPAWSLQAHVSAVDYAPASSRFGPYVDNVLGMNWELPSGRVVRVGERVIKSTTGYDLLRFLLHSDGRYGRARDYVLRLRPLGGGRMSATLGGDEESLDRVRSALLSTSWIHWIDAVTLYVMQSGAAVLHVDTDCAAGEEAIFEGHLDAVRREAGLTKEARSGVHPDGLPALSVKTTVPAAKGIARRLVEENGGTAAVLCMNGVVHYFPPAGRRPVSFEGRLAEQCEADGGHLMGPWAEPFRASAHEMMWSTTLETTWKNL